MINYLLRGLDTLSRFFLPFLHDGRGWCEGCGQRAFLCSTVYYTRENGVDKTHLEELCAACANVKCRWVLPKGRGDG